MYTYFVLYTISSTIMLMVHLEIKPITYPTTLAHALPPNHFQSKRSTMLSIAFSSPLILSTSKLSATPHVLRCRTRLAPRLPQPLTRATPATPCCLMVGGGGSGRILRDVNGFPVIPMSPARQWPPFWVLAAILALALWAWRRAVVRRHLRNKYTRRDLAGDIGAFYDARSAAWESVWGEHMHHGLYDKVNGTRLRGAAAQVRTMDALAEMGGDALRTARRALDVGCGIGGGSRYLARAGAAHVTALTLSDRQAERARELNDEAGLDGRVVTHVRDVLRARLPPRAFDVVWALESAEHIAPKSALARECARVLRPGGTLLMLVWCVREADKPFTDAERFSIRRIMEEYCLPSLSSPSEIHTELVRAGLRKVNVEDWTDRAAPFWGEVARSAMFDPRGWAALFKHGWPLLKSALAMRHVIAGIRQGVFRLYAFSAHMPTFKEVALEEANAIKC